MMESVTFFVMVHIQRHKSTKRTVPSVFKPSTPEGGNDVCSALYTTAGHSGICTYDLTLTTACPESIIKLNSTQSYYIKSKIVKF